MLQWKPSLVAAAAVYLAKRNETLDAWVRPHIHPSLRPATYLTTKLDPTYHAASTYPPTCPPAYLQGGNANQDPPKTRR